jgi:hypothetical protein
MKAFFLLLLALSMIPGIAQDQSRMRDMYPRWSKAQKYAAEGFEPVDCFAGQVRIRGKRVARQPFSVFAPNGDMKCCGKLLKSARTDEHGHFLVEPMVEGEYFAQFELKGDHYNANFAIIEGYRRCDGTHIEVNFSDTNNAKVESFVDIDDSGEGCQENEPRCYRK